MVYGMNQPSATEAVLPKVLVIYAHPEPDSSVANQVMIQRINELDNVKIHDLYANYPTSLLMLPMNVIARIPRYYCFSASSLHVLMSGTP